MAPSFLLWLDPLLLCRPSDFLCCQSLCSPFPLRWHPRRGGLRQSLFRSYPCWRSHGQSDSHQLLQLDLPLCWWALGGRSAASAGARRVTTHLTRFLCHGTREAILSLRLLRWLYCPVPLAPAGRCACLHVVSAIIYCFLIGLKSPARAASIF